MPDRKIVAVATKVNQRNRRLAAPHATANRFEEQGRQGCTRTTRRAIYASARGNGVKAARLYKAATKPPRPRYRPPPPRRLRQPCRRVVASDGSDEHDAR